MKRVLFSKYDSMRIHRYCTKTTLVEEEGQMFFEVTPLYREGVDFVTSLKGNYDKIKSSLKYVVPAPILVDEHRARIKYIKGRSILWATDFKEDPLDKIKDDLISAIKIVFSFNPGILEEGKVKNPNLDFSLMDLIRKNDTIYLVKYQWVDEDPVPLGYLQYKTLKNTYMDNGTMLCERIELKDFLSMFGFKEAAIERYSQMEKAFLEGIYGAENSCDYMERYVKSKRTLGEIIEENDAKDRKNTELESWAKELEEKGAALKSEIEGIKEGFKTSLGLGASLRQIRNASGEKRLQKKIEAADAREGEAIGFKKLITGDYEAYVKNCGAKLNLDYNFNEKPVIDIVTEESSEVLSQQVYQNVRVVESLDESEGDFVVLLKRGDRISTAACYEIARFIDANPGTDIVYFDEDYMDPDTGRRFNPLFKPDYSPDTLLSYNYMGRGVAFRGGLIRGMDYTDIYDLILKAEEKTDRIGHIPLVLYHRGAKYNEDLSFIPGYAMEDEDQDTPRLHALERRGILGRLLPGGEDLPGKRLVYDISGVKLSVIISAGQEPGGALDTVESIAASGLLDVEIILADNGTDDHGRAVLDNISKYYGARVVDATGDLKGESLNKAAGAVQGDYILFAGSLRTLEPGGVLAMLGAASQARAGAVGGKLFEADEHTIWNLGYVELFEGMRPILKGCDDRELFYGGYNKIDRNVSGIHEDCLLISKAKFHEVGGFGDEEVPGIGLCRKLMDAGYHNSIRGDAGFVILNAADVTGKYRAYGGKDPYFNSNFSDYRGDFSLNYEVGCDFDTVETKDSYAQGDASKIRGYIDFVNTDKSIEIHGWAMFNQGNDYKAFKILLEGPSGTYTLGTFREYREDLKESFPQINYSGFSGFYTRAKKQQIPSGNYSIYVIRDKKKFKIEGEINI